MDHDDAEAQTWFLRGYRGIFWCSSEYHRPCKCILTRSRTHRIVFAQATQMPGPGQSDMSASPQASLAVAVMGGRVAKASLRVRLAGLSLSSRLFDSFPFNHCSSQYNRGDYFVL